MLNKFLRIAVLATISNLFLQSGCQAQSTRTNSNNQEQAKNSKTEKVEFPPIGNPQKISDGVLVYEVKLKRENQINNVWIYLPEKPAKEKIPCVLIAPAGSHLIDGMSLGEGDRKEQIPYVKAGFAVISYDIDGEAKDASEASLIKAAKAFKNSNAGLVNQKNALDYALAKFPIIDTEKIFIAGHSSAATHALLVSANEPRVKGVVAYAPATDIEKFIGVDLKDSDKDVPGFSKFILQSSPINITSKIKVPVFLFHAKDDSTVSNEMIEEFVEKLKQTNPNVTFIQVESGNHFGSMIKEGIPKGIEWLNKQIAK